MSRRFDVTNNFKNIPAAIFALFLLSVSTLACTCVYMPVKAKESFRGQVFAVSPDEQLPNMKDPLAKATVQLLRRTEDGQTVVARTVADENGRFVLENVKPGKYTLQAHSPRFQDIFVPIKISAGVSRKKEIIIGLAPGLTCCDGYIKVRKAKKKS